MAALALAGVVVVAFTAAGVAIRLIAAWSPWVAAALLAYWFAMPVIWMRLQLKGTRK